MLQTTTSLSQRTENLIELAQDFGYGVIYDALEWGMMDENFDAGLVNAMPALIDHLGSKVNDLIVHLTDIATTVDRPGDGHSFLRRVLAKAEHNGFDVEAIEEHHILFLPVASAIEQIDSLVDTEDGRRSIIETFTKHSLLASGTELFVCPFTISAHDSLEILPGRLHQFTLSVMEAYERTNRDPKAHQAALMELGPLIKIGQPQAETELAPGVTVTGSRCLILHRIRLGLRHGLGKGALILGHDLDADPFLRPSAVHAEALRKAIDQIGQNHLVMIDEPTDLLTAQTMMVILHIKLMGELDLVAQGATEQGRFDTLHLHRDADTIRVIAVRGTLITPPFEVGLSIAMGNPNAFTANVENLAKNVTLHDTRASFEAVHTEDRDPGRSVH